MTVRHPAFSHPPRRIPCATHHATRGNGFSLIELLVVIAIIGVLAGIALPSYQESIVRSHRVDAKSALLDLSARQQKYYSINNAYTADPASLGYGAGARFPVNVPDASKPTYALNVVLTSSGNGYEATATPINSQARDRCGNFTFNHFGQRGVSQLTTAECW